MIEFNVVLGRLDQKDVSVDLVGWFVVMGGENLSQEALGGDGELKRNEIKSKAHKKCPQKLTKSKGCPVWSRSSTMRARRASNDGRFSSSTAVCETKCKNKIMSKELREGETY